jgi:hypothetical protein
LLSKRHSLVFSMAQVMTCLVLYAWCSSWKTIAALRIELEPSLSLHYSQYVVKVLSSVFAELTSKFSGRTLVNVFLDPFFSYFHNILKTEWLKVYSGNTLFKIFHLCPKKEAMASGYKTLSSWSSTVTHHSKHLLLCLSCTQALFLFFISYESGSASYFPKVFQTFFSAFQQWVSYLAWVLLLKMMDRSKAFWGTLV